MRLNRSAEFADTSPMSVSNHPAGWQGFGASESGGIVISWLVKVAVILALVVVVFYDAVAITYNNVATSEDARTVARAASNARLLSRSTKQEAIAAAEERAQAAGVTLDPKDVVFGTDGSIEVTVYRTVDTLVAHLIGPLEEWSRAVEVYQTPPAP